MDFRSLQQIPLIRLIKLGLINNKSDTSLINGGIAFDLLKNCFSKKSEILRFKQEDFQFFFHAAYFNMST